VCHTTSPEICCSFSNPEANKQKYEKGKLENALSAAGFEKLQHISGDVVWHT
jgi:hypothetical protein